MEPIEYLNELDSALGEYRYRDLRALEDRIDPASFNAAQVKKALGMLRRKRRFSDLEHLAGVFIVAGRGEPFIRRQWAQALLDQNRVIQALRVLEDMSTKFGSDSIEGPEIRGLIGRAYKQLYINGGGSENLRKAIVVYSQDWDRKLGDYRWQGINLAALLARAYRDGVALGGLATPQQVATAILSDIEEKGATGVWDYATAMEASIALGNQSSTLAWAKQYLLHPGADAFELGSTLRQLREVWQLETTEVGQTLLPTLEYAVLQREGASLEPLNLGGTVKRHGFEAIWGDEAYVYLQWLDTLYAQCRAIARIIDTATGAPKGTGFLVSGATLNMNWSESPVLLTNSHVISLNASDEAPLRPEEASAEFTRLPGRPRVTFDKLLFSSPRIDLDVSVVRITPSSGFHILVPCLDLPRIDISNGVRPRVYVAGHPSGGELAVSLYDNSLQECDKQFVRYRSPTEVGNSGSPVFDRQLKSFAIHHRAAEDKMLNEGILFKEIIAAVTRKV